MAKVALITGITGQDGSYLAELLLAKGYKVHGIIRRVALEDEAHRIWRIRHILDDIILHAASLESYASIFKIVQKMMTPSEKEIEQNPRSRSAKLRVIEKAMEII